MSDRTSFNPGTQYAAVDGRVLFVMSGNSDVVDVWQYLGIGRHERVGVMSRDELATLLGR